MCELRTKTVLSSAESAILSITALFTTAWYRHWNMNQAVVTYSMEEARREMLVTQLWMTFNNRHLSAEAQQADITFSKPAT